MNEIDKKLLNVTEKRIMFISHINTLECDHHKLYKKLMPIFDEINQWMSSIENYMNELKESIDKLENRKVYTPYIITPSNLNNPFIKNELSEKQVKINNHNYLENASIKVGYDIKKDNPYV